jgi:hypothetical protein
VFATRVVVTVLVKRLVDVALAYDQRVEVHPRSLEELVDDRQIQFLVRVADLVPFDFVGRAVATQRADDRLKRSTSLPRNPERPETVVREPWRPESSQNKRWFL